MFQRVCLIALLLILPLSSFAKKGYEILVQTPGDTARTYALSGYYWGEKRGIDTVKGDNTFRFSGERLAPGQYVIEEQGRPGERVAFQFFVPWDKSKSRKIRYKFTVTPTGPEQETGTGENEIYLRIQNFLRNAISAVKSPDELANAMTGFYNQARTECPGSSLEYVLKDIVEKPGIPEGIITGFPFDKPEIIRTAFGKEKILKYLRSIALNPNDTLIKLTDNLITTAGKSGSPEIQTLVAKTVFDYFKESDIMGQEGVAVHIAQDWFLNKKLTLPDEESLFLMRTFTELNKHSLIGMNAPELELTDTSGHKIPISSLQGEYTILYFYTDDCVTCKIETPRLVDFVNGYKEGSLNVYAVYAQDNPLKWKTYINREFNIYNPFVNWYNVYDPGFESGFHLLYNVISTPQMFLLDKDGTILGRNLKTKQLEELLNAKNKERDDLYAFFDNFFNKPEQSDTASVNRAIDVFYERSIGNPALFREIFKELYNFLRLSPDYILQNGAAYLAKTYIVGKEALWNNKAFTETIRKALEIFNMNPLGGKAADLSLEDINGAPVNLYDVKNEYKVLYFYKIDCGTCEVVSRELKKLYGQFGVQTPAGVEFIAVNTGRDYGEWIKYVAKNGFSWLNVWGGEDNAEIYKKYYLREVPSIYLLKNNQVIAKDITDIDLAKLLRMIAIQENIPEKQNEIKEK